MEGRILTFWYYALPSAITSEYKIRERIQRGVADPRLLAIPASRSRVADSDPNWGAL